MRLQSDAGRCCSQAAAAGRGPALVFDTELLVLAERAGLRIHEVAVDWTEDPDSRVDILATAAEDLRGILRVSRRLLRGEAMEGLAGRLHDGSRRTLGQLWRFGLIGAASTAGYALLFWLLRSVAPAMIANTLALVAMSVVNTAANRRYTFGVQGRAGLAGDHAGGLVALALALLMTYMSMAALQILRPGPSPATELAALVSANAVATLARFALLRTLILERRRPYARIIEIPRRHS